MKLVVGLGNPGKKYENTRHNVGFEIIRSLAERHAATGSKNKFEGELQECLIEGERVLLLMPHTFMNLSGRSSRQALDFYKIPTEDFLLVCDDFHLPLGKMRLRARGTDGGQKGLADTIRQLGTDEFARLRFGIGPVPENWDPADFVLGKFGKGQQELLTSELIRACDAVDTWVGKGITQAMNQFNATPSQD
ncbi:MAG: aminoacyl-tRNA hydrolase [Pirellulales bacterium]|nr:aminoacyl-tRNA hydrolase [Pirellulales bacterium]